MAPNLKPLLSPSIEDASPELLMNVARQKLKAEQDKGGREPIDRDRAVAITKLEDSILRLNAHHLFKEGA